MTKNYLQSLSVRNPKQFIVYFFLLLFFFIQDSYSQCSTPVVGCSSTDLANFGTDSNTNGATIEYDNYISSFHNTIVRTADGSLQVWGELFSSDGVTNALSPITVNATNFSALTTSTPLKGALGSSSANAVQGIILSIRILDKKEK